MGGSKPASVTLMKLAALLRARRGGERPEDVKLPDERYSLVLDQALRALGNNRTPWTTSAIERAHLSLLRHS